MIFFLVTKKRWIFTEEKAADSIQTTATALIAANELSATLSVPLLAPQVLQTNNVVNSTTPFAS